MRSEQNLCNHPKASDDPIESYVNRIRQLERQLNQLEQQPKQLEKKLKQLESNCTHQQRMIKEHESSKTAVQRQVDAMKQEITRLLHRVEELRSSRDAPGQRNQGLLQTAERSGLMMSLHFDEERSAVSPYHDPSSQSTVGETLTTQDGRAAEIFFDVDYDKVYESNPQWTPWGPVQYWPMQNSAQTDSQSGFINQVESQTIGQPRLFDQVTLWASMTFSDVVPLTNAEMIHSPQPLSLEADSVWGATNVDIEVSIMPEAPFVSAVDNHFGWPTDQGREFAATYWSYLMPVDDPNLQLSTFQSSATFIPYDIR